MHPPPRPFEIPELIHELLGYLHDSELAMCASVDQFWRHAARPRLFGNITIHSDKKCVRFLRILSTSPDISTFVVRLDVYPAVLSPQSFAALVQLPFPQVCVLCCNLCFRLGYSPMDRDFELSTTFVDGIQRLLGLPRLHSVELQCRYDDPRLLWHCAALSIRHVWLSCIAVQGPVMPHVPEARLQRIPLKSLNVWGPVSLNDWLGGGRSPFDVAQLEVLHLRSSTSLKLLRMTALAPAAASLKTLNVKAPWAKGEVDLSAYKRLESFRVCCHSPSYLSSLEDALMTIPTENHIREIVVYGSPSPHIEDYLTEITRLWLGKIQVQSY
ncbi:hypothetical protein GGX14DRAFT_672782 [Mycena pura]|uniref:F-box domain-containing protein n=1 Tax=Mycena pura TaxID=153505 RepID=A0AAD6V091_9AGAR|nr:hypothetical protein GGX14DRAFT_672782 [Mycena pura]